MSVTPEQHRLLVLCAVRAGKEGLDWCLVARQAQLDRGLELLYRGEILENSEAAQKSLPVLLAGLEDLAAAEQRVATELEAAERVGARLTTVLDEDYPANLRLVPDLPPFLFYRGELQPDDARSVAVVGTRDATEKGLRRARQMAGALARHGVTVVSGFARGIDTAAHLQTLDVSGRTIAVLGTGITRCFPPENAGLAERIAETGALVSQFWPTMAPTQFTFPRRNHVSSGITQGTVVIEASRTSGAKMQARIALEHHKRVFLVHSLVTNQQWAQNYLRRGAIEVSEVTDVLRHLATSERIKQASDRRAQLTLEFL
ncbi:MAG: DNA-processing protein DprA [Actinomycetota bacterium]|nr:DNA-processing protein DprA [Actinomycetota bacterium]